MVLSHARQFYGGPPKFKPNPKLERGFNPEASRPPVNDRTAVARRTARLYEHAGSGAAAGEMIWVKTYHCLHGFLGWRCADLETRTTAGLETALLYG